MIAVGLAVSARVRRSSHALALLLAFWVANAVIAPRAAADISRRVHPTPTAFELAERVQRDTYDGLPVHTYNLRRAAELRARLLGTYNVSRIEDLPVNFRGIDYLEREAHANEVWDRHYRALWAAFDRQRAVHDWAGWIAPLVAVRALSMALAGVDVFHHRHFAAEAEAYRRELVLAMNRALAYTAGSEKRGAYTADPSLWGNVEPFAYRQPGMGWALGHARSSWLALSAWWVLACVALLLAVRRAPVES
jgi:ABC-2 type transport system permease protein